MQFEHIECEWPLFFTYLLLHHLFRGNEPEAKAYRDKLEDLLVERDGDLPSAVANHVMDSLVFLLTLFPRSLGKATSCTDREFGQPFGRS